MKNNKKGFTLAELLIVVAIIAVLVAIAIPIFTAQLEKSREATDIANARDAYAEIAVALLDGTITNDGDSFKVSGGYTATWSATAKTVTVANFPITQTVADWKIGTPKVANIAVTGTPVASSANLVFTFTDQTVNGVTSTYLSAVTFANS